MIKAFEKASGKKVVYKIVVRRTDNIVWYYANPALALQEFGWQAKCGFAGMCGDTWRWQAANQNGFHDKKCSNTKIVDQN